MRRIFQGFSPKFCQFEWDVLGMKDYFLRIHPYSKKKKEITSTIPFYKDGMFPPSILLYSYP